MNADLILYNTNVITFDGETPCAEIVAVKGNKIIYVGNKSEISLFKGSETKLLDCEGGSTIPGFNDAHCHPLSFAATLRYVDCAPKQVHQISDILFLLNNKVQETISGQWIRAANYDASTLVEKRPPYRWELDKVTPDNPVILVERSGQQCVLNSLAMKLCGITDAAANGSTNGICFDPISGIPNGIVSGNNEAVATTIPSLSEEEIGSGIKQASEIFLSRGITSIQDTSWTNGLQHWRRMKDYKDNGLLAPRLNFFPGIDALDQFRQAGLKTGDGDHQVRIGGIKIALDESTDNLRPPVEDICHAAIQAYQAGFQLAFHVSDKYMLQASMTALELIKQDFDKTANRPRFEHCPVCPPDLLGELSLNGVCVISQPGLLRAAGPEYLDTTIEEQLGWIYPFNSMHQHGVNLAFSSDCPLVDCNPLQDISTAVTRQVKEGRFLSIGERISILNAFQMYTFAGAYSSFEEKSKGSISVGKLADLVVLDKDLCRIDPEQITELKVNTTIINGMILWQR